MKRREFLRKSAFFGSAALLAPHLLSSCIDRKTPLPGPAEHSVHKGQLRLSWFEYELKLRHTFTVASYSRTTTPGVQVRIEYEGYVGHGEAALPPYLGYTPEGTVSFLRRVDLSRFRSPFLMEDILDYVDNLAPGETPAKAAIDIALHDLTGQLCGQPLYALFGLDPGKTPSTSFTIGIDTPKIVREKTKECADRFNVLKVKVGYDGDEEMIRTIREVTDLPLVVDANQGWTDRKQALDKIYWLREQGVRMIEQPLPKTMLDDTAWLTQHSPLPVYADESVQRLTDLPRIAGAFHGINIKLMKCTGLREAFAMIHYARASRMRVMLGCMTETSAAVTAAATLSPLCDFADLDGNLLISNDLYRGVSIEKRRLILPNRPGLGLLEA
ncbi:MAG: dipeptide epimerase [Paludibacteraceae bacterium]|nr:dipeptide epimerase [Paludibacteraceae bacterium]